jgi:hypothetical protein
MNANPLAFAAILAGEPRENPENRWAWPACVLPVPGTTVSFEARANRPIGHCSPSALDLADVALAGRVVVDLLVRGEAKEVALRRYPRCNREWVMTGKAPRANDPSSPADRGR